MLLIKLALVKLFSAVWFCCIINYFSSFLNVIRLLFQNSRLGLICPVYFFFSLLCCSLCYMFVNVGMVMVILFYLPTKNARPNSLYVWYHGQLRDLLQCRVLAENALRVFFFPSLINK